MNNNSLQAEGINDSAVVDRNFLIVTLAVERVQSRGGNTANQTEMKTALREVERELQEIN